MQAPHCGALARALWKQRLPRGIFVWRTARYLHQRVPNTNTACELVVDRPHAMRLEVSRFDRSFFRARANGSFVRLPLIQTMNNTVVARVSLSGRQSRRHCDA
jgi:hypothetical protein